MKKGTYFWQILMLATVILLGVQALKQQAMIKDLQKVVIENSKARVRSEAIHQIMQVATFFRADQVYVDKHGYFRSRYIPGRLNTWSVDDIVLKADE